MTTEVTNKKGDMNLYAIVIVLVICVTFAGMFEFGRVMFSVKKINTEAQRVIEAFTLEMAKDNYDALKLGNISSIVIDSDKYLVRIDDELHLDKVGNLHYNINWEYIRFYISNPTLTSNIDVSLKLKSTFTVYVPTSFLGVNIFVTEIPMTVQSEYIIK